MAIHGLRMNFDAVILFLSALVLSVFITGRPISQILFTSLIAILFFMKGMNIHTDRIRNNTHKWREILIGNSLNYLMFPLAAFAFAQYLEGSVKYAVLAVGFSAASIGPAVVWAGRAKADTGTASILSFTGILPAIPAVLIALEPVFSIDPVYFAESAFLFALLPLSLGYFSRGIERKYLGDIKHHFSRVALWLVMLVGFVQFQSILAARSITVIYDIAVALSLFMLLTALMAYMGYSMSRHFGIMERKSRAVSLFTGSKSFGVALLIASQIDGLAVLYVIGYFFARHLVMEMLVKQSNRDMLFQNMDGSRLKQRLF